MKYEEAKQLLEQKKAIDEYITDGKCLVKGLMIIEKYKPITDTAAEHDIFFVSEFIEEMSKEDIVQLNRYGFHLCEDSWAYFT